MNLILGNGLLGKELKLQTNWKVISRKNGFDITRPDTFTFIGVPDILVNCVAFTDTYSKLRDEHWNVNYKGVKTLIDYCNNLKIKLVHISTGYVYSGSKSEARETDVPVHNQCWYTYTKLLADGLVQLEANDYLLIRCVHKPKPFPHEKGWIDQVGNFDYVDVIAEKIIKLINKDARGVYNVGTELKTMQELSGMPACFAGPEVPRDISMNLEKLHRCDQ